MHFLTFLDRKPLYYKTFDPTRMQKAYASIKENLPLPPIIHVIGTNGKGSTGRYLASMLHQAGFHVGHYTSPHILRFNERLWLDGQVCSDMHIQEAFSTLQNLLSPLWQEQLSYFEYTTLLAIVLFGACDYVVLEAGLGGEYDATSVFENILTLITPIGLDHAEFLGSTIQSVATTKLNAVQKQALIGIQEPQVVEIAQQLSQMHGWSAFFMSQEQFSTADTQLIQAAKASIGVEYLVQNFTHALAAFRLLGFDVAVDLKTIETIFGRLTRLRPHLYVDVGHNLLAAQRIADHFGKGKVNLVYNSLEDKPYQEILAHLKPIIERVFILPITSPRALPDGALEATLKALEIPYEEFSGINETKTTLVFGSFVVIETFLKSMNE